MKEKDMCIIITYLGDILHFNYLCSNMLPSPLIRSVTLMSLSASMGESSESITSNPVTSLAWVWSLGAAIVVWCGGILRFSSSTASSHERWLGCYSKWLESMTSNPGTSLVQVWSLEAVFVVWCVGKVLF